MKKNCLMLLHVIYCKILAPDLLNFLNAIIQLPYFGTVHYHFKIRTWDWSANSIEPGHVFNCFNENVALLSYLYTLLNNIFIGLFPTIISYNCVTKCITYSTGYVHYFSILYHFKSRKRKHCYPCPSYIRPFNKINSTFKYLVT